MDGHDGAKVRVRVIRALGGEAVEIQVLKLILNGETLPLSEDLYKYSTLHFLGEVQEFCFCFLVFDLGILQLSQYKTYRLSCH